MKPAPYEPGDIVSYRNFNYAVRGYSAERDRITLWRAKDGDVLDTIYHGQEINPGDVVLVRRTVGLSGSAMDELFSSDLAKETALIGKPTRWTQEMLRQRLSTSGQAPVEPTGNAPRGVNRRNGTGGETVDGRVEEWLRVRRRGDAEAARHRYERDEREGRLTWATALSDAAAAVLAEDDPAQLHERLLVLAVVTHAWIGAVEPEDDP